MKRILLIAFFVCLKISIVLANSVHASFICICKVIVDIFQLPEEQMMIGPFFTEASCAQTILHKIITNPSISTQTEESDEQASDKSGTNVKIYNLNSSQKLIISGRSNKQKQCQCCKSAIKESLEKGESVQTDGSDTANSSMSIESDVIDSQILSYCSSSNSSDGIVSTTVATDELEKRDNESLNSEEKREFAVFEKFHSSHFNVYNYRLFSPTDFEEFDFSNDNSNETYVKNGDADLQTENTLREQFRSPQTFYNTDQQSRKTNIKNLATNSNSNCCENDKSGRDFKRRLSLPVKLNTTNTTNFKLIQQSLIEEALQSTQRQNKSLKEIKYPFCSEISLDSKTNDGTDDKAVFSCSSYESLPVSEHFNNAFENSAFLNLCNESLHSTHKLDFSSSVDDVVEAFDLKSLPVEDLSHYPFSAREKDCDEKEIDCKTLNENMSVPSFQKSTIETQNVKESLKQPNDAKKIQFAANLSEGLVSHLTSEINSNTFLTDVHAALDRFAADQVSLVSEKFTKLLNEDVLKADLSRSGDSEIELADLSRSGDSENELADLSRSGNSENELADLSRSGDSEIELADLSRSGDSENETTNISDNELRITLESNKYLENEESILDKNKLNQIKYLSSVGPKFEFSEEQEFASGLMDTFGNIETIRDEKSDYFYYSPNASSKLYTQTVFIDDSPSHDKSPTKQNGISDINSQDPKLSSPTKCAISVNHINSPLSDQFEKASDIQNPAVTVKDKFEVVEQQEKLRQAFQKLHETFRNQILPDETNPTISESNCQSASPTILEMNCQSNYSKKVKSSPLRKRTRGSLRSKIHKKNSILEANISSCDSLTTLDHQSTSIDERSTEENKELRNLSETNCHEHYLENGVSAIEESSSGDSSSDNSVATVKELNTLDVEVEDIFQIGDTESENLQER